MRTAAFFKSNNEKNRLVSMLASDYYNVGFDSKEQMVSYLNSLAEEHLWLMLDQHRRVS